MLVFVLEPHIIMSFQFYLLLIRINTFNHIVLVDVRSNTSLGKPRQLPANLDLL